MPEINLTRFTLQSAFDTAYNGVIAQGGPSMDEAGTCLYRGPNGRKCSLGHLILDEEYDPNWDKKGGAAASGLPLTGGVTLYRLVEKMQEAHDYAAKAEDFMGLFENLMSQVAKDFNLTIPQA
jgi:hypothetical protein